MIIFSGSFVRHSSGNMSDDPFPNAVERLEDPDIDGWDVRFIFDKIAGHQNVPEPDVVIAGLKACRRVNDFALTMRWLEVVHFKSQHNKAIWPYMVQVKIFLCKKTENPSFSRKKSVFIKLFTLAILFFKNNI